jgi:hypothetical protein
MWMPGEDGNSITFPHTTVVSLKGDKAYHGELSLRENEIIRGP